MRAAVLTVVLGACGGTVPASGDGARSATSGTATGTPEADAGAAVAGDAAPGTKEIPMSAAQSPSGEPHPGEIVNVDEIEGRTWTRQASEVPPTIGWVRIGERWEAVVRIVITGTREQRRITKFSRSGEMLESTIQLPPPPARPMTPTPVPTPAPTPTPER